MYIGGAVVTGSSYLAVSSCNMASGGGDAFVVNSAVTFSNFSFLAVTACNINSAGGMAFSMSGDAIFSISSYLALSSCKMKSGGGDAFHANGAVIFTSSSYFLATACQLMGYSQSMYVDRMNVDDSSYVTVMKCTFTSTAADSSF